MRKVIHGFGFKAIISVVFSLFAIGLSIFSLFFGINNNDFFYIFVGICLLGICAFSIYLFLKWKICFYESYFMVPFAINKDEIVERDVRVEYSKLSKCDLIGLGKESKILKLVLSCGESFKIDMKYFSVRQINKVLKFIKEQANIG